MNILSGDTRGLSDVTAFLDTAAQAGQHWGDLFDPNREAIVTRAPGRLDLMGGIADYSGALVLQLPLATATLCAAQLRNDRAIRIVSLPREIDRAARVYQTDLETLRGLGYEGTREIFSGRPGDAWAAYVAGAVTALERECGALPDRGASLLLYSQVPEGKGVSSSAALEVATMKALCELYGVALTPEHLALACQKVENRVVGAACGVMDQMTSACGRQDRLLRMLCQPARVLGHMPLPSQLNVWGIDSDIRHQVAGADYGSVRIGAFMGYRMIADVLGLSASVRDGCAEVQDDRFHGYLANITPSEFRRRFEQHLPVSIMGRQFLERFGPTSDSVTRIDPGTRYAVREPTAHPVFEHHRVQTFAALLQHVGEPGVPELLGELMLQSHASYAALGLGSDGTDRLVALALEAGIGAGIYGAKITGGGSGGTVAILGRAGASETIAAIAARYGVETRRRVEVFSGSSPGAAAFGHLRVTGIGQRDCRKLTS
jgi:galactokinase